MAGTQSFELVLVQSYTSVGGDGNRHLGRRYLTDADPAFSKRIVKVCLPHFAVSPSTRLRMSHPPVRPYVFLGSSYLLAS